MDGPCREPLAGKHTPSGLTYLRFQGGAVSKTVFMENAMCDRSTALCRSVFRQALASAPLQARLDGRPILPSRPVPADGLA